MLRISTFVFLCAAGCGTDAAGTRPSTDAGADGDRPGSGGASAASGGATSDGGSNPGAGGRSTGGRRAGGAGMGADVASGGAPASGGAGGAGGAGGNSAGSGGTGKGTGGASKGTGGRAGSGGAGGSAGGAGGGAGGAGGAPANSAGCGKTSPTGDHVITIDVAGVSRTYLLSVPASYAKDKPSPLYFVFHGYGGSHDSVTGFGFQNKYVSVFPDGIARDSAPSGWDESPTSTDVTLFDQALSATLADYCIDTGRVYAVGFSWGGWMATALGCLRGNVVHGFASVEGGVLNSAKDCKGPVPGWINHYKDDPAEPFSSGQHEVDFFTALDKASNPMPYDAPLQCVEYTGTAPLVFCTPDGAVHDWPDYATASIEKFFGTP